MGNHTSTIAPLAVLGGFLYCGLRVQSALPAALPIKRNSNASFISLSSIGEEHYAVEDELERTAELISSIKKIIAQDVPPTRKRQLEESLMRAENSFNSLFELKSKVEEHQTTGLMLESQISAEVAKSLANRDIESRILFGTTGGDSSPFKRQKTG